MMTAINAMVHAFALNTSSDYPSYFAPQMRWLYSLTPVAELSKLPGIHELAAFLQHELFRVIRWINWRVQIQKSLSA